MTKANYIQWLETQVQKMHDKERKSFKKEQSDKLETDYKWIGEQDENLAFAKMIVIVFIVIIGLIVWAVIA